MSNLGSVLGGEGVGCIYHTNANAYIGVQGTLGLPALMLIHTEGERIWEKEMR